jgi:hypothetical protein
MADAFDTIVIVSDPRAVPGRADRLAYADDYRLLERRWLKAPTAVRDLPLMRDRVLCPRRRAEPAEGGA